MKNSKYLYIKTNWCKRCGICVEYCPKKALFFGTGGFPEWDGEKCVQCFLCVSYCPDFAIFNNPEKVLEYKER